MTASERRRFILDELRQRGKVTYAQIRKAAGNDVKRASIRQDVEHLRELGFDIVAVTIEGEERALIDRSSTNYDSVPERVVHRQEEKQRIASFAYGLCCGFRETTVPETGGRVAIDLNRDFTINQIAKALGDDQMMCPLTSRKLPQKDRTLIEKAIEGNVIRLTQSLALWWQQHSRLIAVDGGTTNLELAKLLAKTPIPTPRSSLQFLTLCTNYRLIFNELGKSNIDTRAMMIGGRQIPGSNTVGGFEALTFLRALKSLRFGISIIGSSHVDFNPGRFEVKTSNPDEAELKSLLLERSEIKVVVADDGKFGDHAFRNGFGFARLDQVDLIITNQPNDCDSKAQVDEGSRPLQRDSVNAFARGVISIRKRGIPVVVVGKRNQGASDSE